MGVTRRYRPARTRPVRSATPLVRIPAKLPAFHPPSAEGPRVTPDVITFLEKLFEAGFAWDEAALDALCRGLEPRGGPRVAERPHGCGGGGLPLGAGDVSNPRRGGGGGVISPRLWKVLEAVRAGL